MGKLHPAAGLGQFGDPQIAFHRARRDMQNDAVTARLAVYPADLTLAPNMRIEALGADSLGLAATQWRIAQVEHHHDGRGGSATSLDLSLWHGGPSAGDDLACLLPSYGLLEKVRLRSDANCTSARLHDSTPSAVTIRSWHVPTRK